MRWKGFGMFLCSTGPQGFVDNTESVSFATAATLLELSNHHEPRLVWFRAERLPEEMSRFKSIWAGRT